MFGSMGANTGAKIAIRSKRTKIARKGEIVSGSFFDHLANVPDDEVRDVMPDLPSECAGR
ncbi:hypothetical protein D3C81_2254400 [compost metagenome]